MSHPSSPSPNPSCAQTMRMAIDKGSKRLMKEVMEHDPASIGRSVVLCMHDIKKPSDVTTIQHFMDLCMKQSEDWRMRMGLAILSDRSWHGLWNAHGWKDTTKLDIDDGWMACVFTPREVTTQSMMSYITDAETARVILPWAMCHAHRNDEDLGDIESMRVRHGMSVPDLVERIPDHIACHPDTLRAWWTSSMPRADEHERLILRPGVLANACADGWIPPSSWVTSWAKSQVHLPVSPSHAIGAWRDVMSVRSSLDAVVMDALTPDEQRRIQVIMDAPVPGGFDASEALLRATARIASRRPYHDIDDVISSIPHVKISDLCAHVFAGSQDVDIHAYVAGLTTHLMMLDITHGTSRQISPDAIASSFRHVLTTYQSHGDPMASSEAYERTVSSLMAHPPDVRAAMMHMTGLPVRALVKCLEKIHADPVIVCETMASWGLNMDMMRSFLRLSSQGDPDATWDRACGIMMGGYAHATHQSSQEEIQASIRDMAYVTDAVRSDPGCGSWMAKGCPCIDHFVSHPGFIMGMIHRCCDGSPVPKGILATHRDGMVALDIGAMSMRDIDIAAVRASTYDTLDLMGQTVDGCVPSRLVGDVVACRHLQERAPVVRSRIDAMDDEDMASFIKRCVIHNTPVGSHVGLWYPDLLSACHAGAPLASSYEPIRSVDRMEKHPYTTTGMLMRLRDIHGVMSRWLADPRQPNDGRLAIALMAASHDDRMYAVLPAIIDAIPRRGLVMESAGDPGCDWDIIASPHLVSTWSMERPDIAIAALTMIRHRSHVRMPFYALPWGTWEPSDRERVSAAMRQVVTEHPSMASGWMDRCWGTAWMRQDEQRLGVWPLFSNPDVASRAIAAGVDRHMITTLAIMHPHSGMATLERMGTIPESWS